MPETQKPLTSFRISQKALAKARRIAKANHQTVSGFITMLIEQKEKDMKVSKIPF